MLHHFPVNHMHLVELRFPVTILCFETRPGLPRCCLSANLTEGYEFAVSVEQSHVLVPMILPFWTLAVWTVLPSLVEVGRYLLNFSALVL
jgi:hypothetical protein